MVKSKDEKEIEERVKKLVKASPLEDDSTKEMLAESAVRCLLTLRSMDQRRREDKLMGEVERTYASVASSMKRSLEALQLHKKTNEEKDAF